MAKRISPLMALTATGLCMGIIPAVFAGTQILPIVDYLTRYSGQQVIVYGTLTDEVHQHMVQPPPEHQKIAYLRPDSGGQMVIYLAKEVAPCRGALKLSGRVLELRGPSKRPGGPPSKVDETYVEHQLQVENSLCLPTQGLEVDLRLLGQAKVSVAEKQLALARLFKSQKGAIPLLIGHLNDQRIYEKSKTLPPPLNAPAHAAPAPQMVVDIPVSEVVSDLLYQIITPVYSSPHATRGKVYSHSVFLVKDWSRWWKTNQHKTLAQIHTELRPKVDAYWLGKGLTQILN